MLRRRREEHLRHELRPRALAIDHAHDAALGAFTQDVARFVARVVEHSAEHREEEEESTGVGYQHDGVLRTALVHHRYQPVISAGSSADGAVGYHFDASWLPSWLPA